MRARKATDLTRAYTSYADNGSAADAEIAIAQIDNEIALREAQLRTIADRTDEVQRQTEREAEDAAQRARDEVMARIEQTLADLAAEVATIEDEIATLTEASDVWQELLINRRAAEAGSGSGASVPPPPSA